MWRKVLRVLKVYTGEWCWEKKSRRKEIAEVLCVANPWFNKADKRSLIVLVDVKQKLILCLWEENTKSI